jgi:tetratricopeptide (TPR) repeat protein
MFALLESDDPDGQAFVETLAADDPGWALPDAALAIYALRKDDPDLAAAQALAESAVEKDAQEPLAHYALGLVYEAQEQYADAQAEYSFVVHEQNVPEPLVQAAQERLDTLPETEG